MPVERAFFDSNTIIYAQDKSAPDKQAKARQWLSELAERQLACTNLQVLNEIANVLLKRRWFSNDTQVWDALDLLAPLGTAPLSTADVQLARQIRLQTRHSWWDCLLLASAISLGCSHFLSEDLQDGQRIGPLTVIDPFQHHPSDIIGKPGN